MLAGVLFGKKYTAADYVVTLCLCAGLYEFASADATTSGSFAPLGLLLMTLSTSADAVRLNLSEQLMRGRARKTSVGELMLYSEGFGLLLVLPLALLNGELYQSMFYFYNNPSVLFSLIVSGFVVNVVGEGKKCDKIHCNS
jgi:hypothetical protein